MLFVFPLSNFHNTRSAMRGTMRGSNDFKVLHSWMYPQSVLPPSLILVLSQSTVDGGNQAAFNVAHFSFFSVLFLFISLTFHISFLCNRIGVLKKTTSSLGRILSRPLLHAPEEHLRPLLW